MGMVDSRLYLNTETKARVLGPRVPCCGLFSWRLWARRLISTVLAGGASKCETKHGCILMPTKPASTRLRSSNEEQAGSYPARYGVGPCREHFMGKGGKIERRGTCQGANPPPAHLIKSILCMGNTGSVGLKRALRFFLLGVV